jgi:TatD DNase family protein
MKANHIPMFDSHSHLQMAAFAGDLPKLLEEARADGFQGTVVIGMDVPSSRQAIDLAGRYSDIYAAVGVHPHDAACVDADVLQSLREMIREPGVVAVGETGLDLYRNLSPAAAQRRAFREQLALANEADLPVVIHSRQANEETLHILRKWAGEKRRETPVGVLHCFAGNRELAGEYVKLGFMISFAGNVTYPNARRLQQTVVEVPLENLLVETDAPFLPPQSHRGRRCEPSHIRETIEFIAGLRGVSAAEIGEATAANAERIYRLKERTGKA